VAFDCSRLKTRPAASLTLNFLATLFNKTFAFAILAFQFWFARVLLHIRSKSYSGIQPSSGASAINSAAVHNQTHALQQNSIFIQSLHPRARLECWGR
jgi:hypothetical protein